MPVATDKRQRMFNARNLNDLYARFDNKCARALDGKTPFVVGLSSKIPFGVQYDYCIDPATSFYVTGSTPTQTHIAIELSKLESKHLDVSGGQVYVDHYVTSFTLHIATLAQFKSLLSYTSAMLTALTTMSI